MKIFLDDERMAWDETWAVVRNFESCKKEVLRLLRSDNVNWEISLDNDLGEEKEGYQIAQLIEENFYTDSNANLPKKIIVHTANTIARQKMTATCRSMNFKKTMTWRNSSCTGDVWEKN
jgi:hypothetical protein